MGLRSFESSARELPPLPLKRPFRTRTCKSSFYISRLERKKRKKKKRRTGDRPHFRHDRRAEASTAKSKVIQQLAWRKWLRYAANAPVIPLQLRHRNGLTNSLIRSFHSILSREFFGTRFAARASLTLVKVNFLGVYLLAGRIKIFFLEKKDLQFSLNGLRFFAGNVLPLNIVPLIYV